jgi:hypothetical protein
MQAHSCGVCVIFSKIELNGYGYTHALLFAVRTRTQLNFEMVKHAGVIAMAAYIVLASTTRPTLSIRSSQLHLMLEFAY